MEVFNFPKDTDLFLESIRKTILSSYPSREVSVLYSTFRDISGLSFNMEGRFNISNGSLSVTKSKNDWIQFELGLIKTITITQSDRWCSLDLFMKKVGGRVHILFS